METETIKVLCGKCRIPVHIVCDDRGDEFAVCPGCGLRDTKDSALHEAVRHAARQKMRDVLASFDGIKASLVQGSPAQVVDPPFRFISERSG